MTTPQTPVESERRPLRTFDAYYYSLEATGVEAIDKVLQAVAAAGAGWHDTEDWRTVIYGRPSAETEIQRAANEAATTLRAKADDSARLDWLSEQPGIMFASNEPGKHPGCSMYQRDEVCCIDATSLREAIDAARSAPVLDKDGTNGG